MDGCKSCCKNTTRKNGNKVSYLLVGGPIPHSALVYKMAFINFK